MNAGPYIRVTDGRGKFWELPITRDHKIKVTPAAWNTHPTEDRLVGALEEAERALEALISTFTPQTPLEDPVHGEEVATLGRRIGFGALMVSAAATWRDQSCVAGGEFVVGPCALTADVELAKARAALTRIRAAKGGE